MKLDKLASEPMETGVLACMLQNRAVAIEKARVLQPLAFFNPANRSIFNHLLLAHNGGKPTDLLSFQEFLRTAGVLEKVGGPSRLTDLQTSIAPIEVLDYYLDQLNEKYRERQLLDLGEHIAKREVLTLPEIQERLVAIERNTSRNGDKPVEKSWNVALNESAVTSRELEGLVLAPRKKLLGDWFCEGDLGFIFAFRGVGKTWLALAMARALSTKGKLGDWKAHERARVLYLDGEMPPDLMRDRARGLESGNDDLIFLNHQILFERAGRVLNITRPEVQNAITAHCVEARVKVLFLDNLSTLASGMKENEADSWELVNSWLLDLRRRKIAVVIVHHAGRSGEMRGTTKREDNVFWIIALDDMKKNADDKRGARFVSRFTKPSRNTQEEVQAFEWHFVTEDGEVSIAHKAAQTLDVFRSVIESGVTKCDEIAAAMNLANYEVSRLAKKGVDAGWLDKGKRGEYAILGGVGNCA